MKYVASFLDNIPLERDVQDGGAECSKESVMTTGSLNEFLDLTREPSGLGLLAQRGSPNSRFFSLHEGSPVEEPYWLDCPSSDESSIELAVENLETAVYANVVVSEDAIRSGTIGLCGDGAIQDKCATLQDIIHPINYMDHQETNFEALFEFSDLLGDLIPTHEGNTSAEPLSSRLVGGGETVRDPVLKVVPHKAKSSDLPRTKKGMEESLAETTQDACKRTRKNYDAPLGYRVYFDLTALDVGLGRGGEMNRHPGNLQFHEAKRRMQPKYKASPKSKRTAIAQELVEQVHEWGGRFLKKDLLGFYEVHNHTARTKCSQALREEYSQEERAAKRLKFRLLRQQSKVEAA